MTYPKTLLTVEITTKDGGTITVADTEQNMIGTAVWNALLDGDRILYKDGTKWQYIEHDCVCTAEATENTIEVTVEDANCNYQPCEEP